MPLSTTVNRITSKDLRLYFTPFNTEASSYVGELTVDTAQVTGNLFFRVNGVLTTAVSLSAYESALDAAAEATLIQTALEGTVIPLADGTTHTIVTADITVAPHATKTGVHTITVEGAGDLANRVLMIRIDPSTSNYRDADHKLTVVTPGSERIRIDAEAYAFDFQTTTETTDATALSEFHDISLAIRQSASGSLSLYHASQGWRFIFGADNLEGRMEVYGKGVGSGLEGNVLDCRWEEYSETYPDHEKVEIEISWTRLGEAIMRPGDLQA